MSERTAIVVGAGIAGLATAGGLARTGWKVTLLERADRLRPGRAAVQIWPNGVRALESLGLAEALESVATPMPQLGVRRPDGRILHPTDDTVPRPVLVHRADLHDVFMSGLGDQVEIRTGFAVRTVGPTSQRPSVGDGATTCSADLVVGADGTDSMLRRRLAPAATLVSAGYARWRAVIPWFRAPNLSGELAPGAESFGDGHRFTFTALGTPGTSRGGLYWAAAVPGAARPEPPETQLALLRRWFAGWHAPIGDLLAATHPEDLVQETVRELRPLPAFAHAAEHGGYALAGDAAHAMSAHAGQGAGLALEDAAVLQHVLRGAVQGSIGDALEEYARVRAARITRFAAHSRKLDAALQARGRFSVSGRFAPRLLDRVALAGAEWVAPGPRP
ncbi:monooxygenase [Virgisporangium aliadipatigenens]|uniref:Monooxygenase n=1 Tax=Virgisporangium aliadipatigenens TaxID=741659 RepID=A0A8J3YYD1_9ACTN|nr:NAD(P)/FAD-dependent oxidoreductase [Virgisporangium aliadipatigenens]GIJ52035.1 monooxygenase [Virgisporangium aliadipatigenens]